MRSEQPAAKSCSSEILHRRAEPCYGYWPWISVMGTRYRYRPTYFRLEIAGRGTTSNIHLRTSASGAVPCRCLPRTCRLRLMYRRCSSLRFASPRCLAAAAVRLDAGSRGGAGLVGHGLSGRRFLGRDLEHRKPDHAAVAGRHRQCAPVSRLRDDLERCAAVSRAACAVGRDGDRRDAVARRLHVARIPPVARPRACC